MTYLTKVHITDKEAYTYRLLLGHPASCRDIGGLRYNFFAAGEIFMYSRWKNSRYGTSHWNIYFVMTGSPGEEIIKIPGIMPGAKLISYTQGKHYSQKLLSCLKKVDPQQPIDLKKIKSMMYKINMGLDCSEYY